MIYKKSYENYQLAGFSDLFKNEGIFDFGSTVIGAVAAKRQQQRDLSAQREQTDTLLKIEQLELLQSKQATIAAGVVAAGLVASAVFLAKKKKRGKK